MDFPFSIRYNDVGTTFTVFNNSNFISLLKYMCVTLNFILSITLTVVGVDPVLIWSLLFYSFT